MSIKLDRFLATHGCNFCRERKRGPAKANAYSTTSFTSEELEMAVDTGEAKVDTCKIGGFNKLLATETSMYEFDRTFLTIYTFIHFSFRGFITVRGSIS